ncbi:hypothetical protein NDU88_002264 [Pleurodeles waltl]|uniref:Uncharacterized protein n=1 Tax=Pleurodeles waltl TaxID=8319 RepID=A0AAV7U968_PLEWA|nr:hypothetical protein NDU88_002264 [Pleurodeles waltl]
MKKRSVPGPAARKLDRSPLHDPIRPCHKNAHRDISLLWPVVTDSSEQSAEALSRLTICFIGHVVIGSGLDLADNLLGHASSATRTRAIGRGLESSDVSLTHRAS